jgi:bifunctional DNase/RNase
VRKPRRKHEELVEMATAELAVDPIGPLGEMPILILRDATGTDSVAIAIGRSEAAAIASELEGIRLARPMTHDLMRAIVDALAGCVKRVEVRDLRGGTFHAHVVIERDGAEVSVDARPSDAVALALRSRAPIQVTRRVIEEARSLAGPAAACDGDRPPARDLLASLTDEDFGKWKM